MKKNTIFLAMVAIVALGGAAFGETVVGASGAFWVDTRCKDFVIEDVTSTFCHGVYGMKGGQKATFLNGVSANVAFEVTGRSEEVEIRRVEVQGVMHEGRTFSLDVGSLGVGEIVQVVAYGEMGGAEVISPPFRVNCDVASVPFPGWVGGTQEALAEYAKDLAKGKSELAATALSVDWGKRETERMPWWMPPQKLTVAPSLGLSAKYSLKSGVCTITAGKVGQSWLGGHMFRRSNGQFLKWGNTSFGWNANGELRLEWNPERLEWEWKSAGITGTVSGELKGISWQTMLGPVPVFLKPELKGDVSAAVRVYGLGGLSDLELSANSRHFPTVGGKVGAGVYPAIGIYAGVTGSGELDGRWGGPRGSDLSFGVYASVVGGVAVLGWTPEIQWDSSTWWLFGEKAGARGGRDALPEVKWVPMGRDYLRRAGTRGTEKPGFEAGGYPNPAPSAARGSRGDWVAYLRDDGTRGDADRTQVVVQSGAGGAWGAAEKVWDDGTADWMPSLGVAGDGTAVLAWANARAGSGGESLEAACKGLELAVAVRNAETGAWVAWNLTDDSAADFSPVVCAAGDGTAMVAWLRNEGGALFGSAESPTAVMSSRWGGSAWSAPSELGCGAVSRLDLAYDGTNACVAWAFDGDEDWETAGDAGVSAAVWSSGTWGAAEVMAEGLEGVGPVVAGVDGRGRPSPWCLWGEGWRLMERAADGEGKAVAAAVAWEGEIPGTARAVHGADGAVGLAWEDEGRPVVMGYDAGMGAWGGPMTVGEREVGRMAKGVAAAIGADGVLAAWESVAVATNAEGVAEFGGTELRVVSVAASMANPGGAADGFSFATNEVVAGELTGVQVTVRNTGMEGASNVALRVWACDGELEEDEDARWELLGEDGEPVVLDLPGGAEVAATVMWMAEDYRTNLTFVARVEVPEEVGDADAGDNEAVWRPGTPELRLENARCDAVGGEVRLLTATVRNGGLAAAEAGTEVSFRLGAPDGEEIGRDVAGIVPAGADHGYDAGIAWDMSGGTWTGAWVTVYAVIDTGNAEADASSAVPIRVMTPLDRDGDGVLDGEETAMGTDPLKEDTNGDGVSDYEHVYVFFTDPLAGMGVQWTTNTPEAVPFTWLEGWPEALAAHGGDHEAFAADTAANGRAVWECYVAGLDPTDKDDELKVALVLEEDGKWRPQIVSGKKENRTYEFEGAEWMPVEGGEGKWGKVEANSRFFRARVTVEEE